MVAALFVAKGGVYFNLPDVDPWDESRDARKYAGPWPVVAHPPCNRWSQLARIVQARWGYRIGDDGGTFASALASVRRYGGVLEHPAHTMAWAAHGLQKPPLGGGWQRCLDGGWVCQVSQIVYGHLTRKRTWLYYFGQEAPPSLDWRSPESEYVVTCDNGKDGRNLGKKKELPHGMEHLTPVPFRDLLLSIAATARPEHK